MTAANDISKVTVERKMILRTNSRRRFNQYNPKKTGKSKSELKKRKILS